MWCHGCQLRTNAMIWFMWGPIMVNNDGSLTVKYSYNIEQMLDPLMPKNASQSHDESHEALPHTTSNFGRLLRK